MLRGRIGVLDIGATGGDPGNIHVHDAWSGRVA